ncbi:MAG TPA: CAP domain-containing protein, partial [Thermoanaerobaculia bacterium]
APDGTDPFVWVTRRGYDFRKAGENLAVGYRGAEEIVEGWMSSPGHRANILNPAYEEVGLAVAGGSPTSSFRGPTVVALYALRGSS